MHDTISVNVKRHLNLRHAPRRRRDADEVELPEQLVVCGHVAFTLEHLDPNLRLVVCSS